MQIVSNGDNLYEISIPVFWKKKNNKKKKKYHQFVVVWISRESGKGQAISIFIDAETVAQVNKNQQHKIEFTW